MGYSVSERHLFGSFMVFKVCGSMMFKVWQVDVHHSLFAFGRHPINIHCPISPNLATEKCGETNRNSLLQGSNIFRGELLVSGRVAVQLIALDDEVIYHITFHTFTLGILAHSPSENVFMEPKFTVHFGGDEGRPNHPLTSHWNPKQPPGMYKTL